MKQPSKEIVEYVAECILPVYTKKILYKREHIDYVLRRSTLFANQVASDDFGKPINFDMVYLIGAYHDIGEVDNRETHELVGAKMLREDKSLQEFFTPEQIEIMAQAVEDHRASGKTKPRTIYGRIISSADRTTSINDIMRLSYGFRTRRGATDLQEIIDDSFLHICEKYGANGYAMQKMYFNDPEFDDFKIQTIELSKDKTAFTKRFLEVNGIRGEGSSK